ncbi:MAG TPA: aminodeoxychorismate synthase component I, partial [Ectothiorhodospiraceae bacterium]|nr:aminodeoxychorismate synthase component I [Ectothiorhodospiraceae bacterium]
MIHKEQQLDYMSDPAIYFERLRDEPWAIWLDSDHVAGTRYDILVARPYRTFVTRGRETTITDAQGVTTSKRAPLQLIEESLQVDEKIDISHPFSGGAVGLFGYELDLMNCRPEQPKDESPLPPDMAIGLYNCAIIFDHLAKTVTLSGLFDESDDIEAPWNSLLQKVTRPTEPHTETPFKLDGPFSESLSYDQYQKAFSRIQHYLQEGDCYQVNLTQRFSAPCHGELWPLYREIRKRHPAPYGAYMQLGDIEVLSFSPEQFLKVTQDLVTTSPIKGTRPRYDDPIRDQQALTELQQSEKDRAENLMIVD